MLEQKPRAAKARSNTARAAKATAAANGASERAEGTLYDRESIQRVEADRTQWEATSVTEAVKRVPERFPERTTQSGMPIKRLYTPADGAQLDYERDLGFPGEYPYTRGVQPTMYRAKPWTMRMFAGFGTAEETNERFKYLLEQGQTGLSVAFDMATLYGYDHDHPDGTGRVRQVRRGRSRPWRTWRSSSTDIPLDQVTTSMTINSPAAAIWAMYIAAAEKQGVPMEQLCAARCRTTSSRSTSRRRSFSSRPSLRCGWSSTPSSLARATCPGGIPSPSPATTSARRARPPCRSWPSRWPMAWPTWTLPLERGLAIDEFAPRLSFFFDVHNDFFEEIAKFRAARRIWAREMRERYGAKDPRSWMLRTHAQTAGVSLTAQQPEINVARVAIQALAAVLGGTNSLHTNSLDEALALPTEKAALIALRTQQLIAHESGVVNTVDPLAGSFFVEALTDETERQAVGYIEQIRELGGVLECIRNGFFQKEIAEASYRFQCEVEARERIIVGVNDYVMDEALSVPTLYVDPAKERIHLERLHRVRRERDNERAGAALAALERAARGTENTMPYLLECARAYCSLGEMMGVFRKVFGDYTEMVVY